MSNPAEPKARLLSRSSSGPTEIEVRERKDLVDDALKATRAVVEEGIVGDGGVAQSGDICGG